MNDSGYFENTANLRTRMPNEVADIMGEISEKVSAKLGELSLLADIAETMPPVQRALVLSSIEEPGFLFKAARRKHEVLANLPRELLPFEKVQVEEALYENGVTAKWHTSKDIRRTRHELIVYFVKQQPPLSVK